jgi:hypothetical protein
MRRPGRSGDEGERGDISGGMYGQSSFIVFGILRENHKYHLQPRKRPKNCYAIFFLLVVMRAIPTAIRVTVTGIELTVSKIKKIKAAKISKNIPPSRRYLFIAPAPFCSLIWSAHLPGNNSICQSASFI